MTNPPIFAAVEHDFGDAVHFAERAITRIRTHGHYHHNQAHEGTTAMSITTIADDLEQGISKGLTDLRNLATAFDSNSLVQKALGVAEEVAPEVREFAAKLLPVLTAIDPAAVTAVEAAINGILALVPKAPVAVAPAA